MKTFSSHRLTLDAIMLAYVLVITGKTFHLDWPFHFGVLCAMYSIIQASITLWHKKEWPVQSKHKIMLRCIYILLFAFLTLAVYAYHFLPE